MYSDPKYCLSVVYRRYYTFEKFSLQRPVHSQYNKMVDSAIQRLNTKPPHDQRAVILVAQIHLARGWTQLSPVTYSKSAIQSLGDRSQFMGVRSYAF